MKQQMGTLKLDAFATKKAQHLSPVALTGGLEGSIKLGEPVEIVSGAQGSRLAVDLNTVDRSQSTVTATSDETYSGPSSRTTFVLEQYVPPKANAYDTAYEGDVLRYGMKVRILANATSLGANLGLTGQVEETTEMLASKPVSSGFKARLSKHQLVSLYRAGPGAYDAVWVVVPPRAEDRLVAMGVEVLQGAPVALVHCGTNAPLRVELGYKNLTDFGYEFEVSASVDGAANRLAALDDLFQGKDLGPTNQWVFNVGYVEKEEGAEQAGEEAVVAE